MATEPSPIRAELDRVGTSFHKAGAADYITVTENEDAVRLVGPPRPRQLHRPHRKCTERCNSNRVLHRSRGPTEGSKEGSVRARALRLSGAVAFKQLGRFHERQLRDVACPAGRQGTGRVGGRALRHACSLACRAAGRIEAGRAVCL
jgi:hypothetical protein